MLSVCAQQRYTDCPELLRYSKHRALLHEIATRLTDRAHNGQSTHIRKVPAHVGIQGNELADQGATAVATGKVAPTYVCTADNEPYRRHWWVARSDTQRAASDLNRGVLSLLDEDTHVGYRNPTVWTRSHSAAGSASARSFISLSGLVRVGSCFACSSQHSCRS